VARLYVTCPKCSHRSDRAGGRRKCQGCGAPLPKRRVPKHARTLRDDSYAAFVQVNELIHGAGEDCGVCGKPRKFERRHDRDHDHVTGLPRGLACPGNQGCNALMPRWLTAERARAIAEYLERVEAFRAREAAA
jgi:Recombination endonuclease VII